MSFSVNYDQEGSEFDNLKYLCHSLTSPVRKVKPFEPYKNLECEKYKNNIHNHQVNQLSWYLFTLEKFQR
jgi:hypothetical protein